MISILMHDDNNDSAWRSHNSSGRNHRDGSDRVVIDATNINCAMRVTFNDPGIATGNTSIGTTINERTWLAARGL